MNLNLETSPCSLYEDMVKSIEFKIIGAHICVLALPYTSFETFGMP